MGKNRQKANLTSNNLITSDITNDRIGINSTSPTTTLDVAGIVSATSLYVPGVDGIYAAQAIKSDLGFYTKDPSDGHYSYSIGPSGHGLLIQSAGGTYADIKISPHPGGYVVVSGIVSATGFSTSGGTSSQFLKADGSVDSSTYLTSSGDGSSLTGLTGASAATYGDASNVAQIQVDANGRITSISNVAVSGGGGGGASEAFKTIAVSGQSDVVADSATDTLTLVAGSNMTITTNASGDSVTFASSGGGGGGSGISAGKSIALSMIFG